MQVYNVRKLHFPANLCEVFTEDKKQHCCGDLDLRWAVLLFMKSSRIIILIVYTQQRWRNVFQSARAQAHVKKTMDNFFH